MHNPYTYRLIPSVSHYLCDLLAELIEGQELSCSPSCQPSGKHPSASQCEKVSELLCARWHTSSIFQLKKGTKEEHFISEKNSRTAG